MSDADERGKQLAALVQKQLPVLITSLDETFPETEKVFFTPADTSDEAARTLIQQGRDCAAMWPTIRAEALRVLAAAEAGREEVDPGLFRVGEPYPDLADGSIVPGLLWTETLMPTWMALVHAQNRAAALSADHGAAMLGLWQVQNPELTATMLDDELSELDDDDTEDGDGA